jgi:hypothetical protein
VSIRVETIARPAELRNRSARTLALLLTGLLVAALLAVPDQRRWALGTDTSHWPSSSSAWRKLDRLAGRQSGSAIGQLLDAINPTIVTCSPLVVVAVVLILGLYLLAPALIAVLAGGVVNAWLILVRLTD